MVGCSTATQQALPQEISLTTDDPQYIRSITFEYPGAEFSEDSYVAMEACVLENAKAGVQRQNKGETVGDGQIILSGNKDRGYIIARGVTSIQDGILYRMITYQVRVVEGQPRTIKYTSMKQGIGSYTDTDMDSNFTPVGAWSGAKPMKTYDAVKAAAGTLNACIDDW